MGEVTRNKDTKTAEKMQTFPGADTVGMQGMHPPHQT